MKPYIICYMMESIDGRIDCGMTAQLPGTDEYYQILEELNLPTTLSGRNTAELEMSLPGKFEAKNPEPVGKESLSKAAEAGGYEVIVDTKGKLLWEDQTGADKPLLIITSTQASKEYLQYLDGQHISWIACGNEKIDLSRAVDILNTEFGVERMGIVGGPGINTGFLNAGLLDEVVILIGPGIDGRVEFPSVFEGREESTPLQLHREYVKLYDNGAVLIGYKL